MERPCSSDFAIMKSFNFMRPSSQFAVTVIAKRVPTSKLHAKTQERKDAKAASIHLTGLCAFASFFKPLRETISYVSA